MSGAFTLPLMSTLSSRSRLDIQTHGKLFAADLAARRAEEHLAAFAEMIRSNRRAGLESMPTATPRLHRLAWKALTIRAKYEFLCRREFGE